MTTAEFSPSFNRLLDAHGKSFHEGISDAYFEQFKGLTESQWYETVSVLVRTCETFPKIPTIRKVIGEKGYWNNSTANSGMYLFTCHCKKDIEMDMVTNAGRLTKAIEEKMSYKCPNHIFGCNKIYDAEYFRQHSTYIKP